MKRGAGCGAGRRRGAGGRGGAWARGAVPRGASRPGAAGVRRRGRLPRRGGGARRRAQVGVPLRRRRGGAPPDGAVDGGAGERRGRAARELRPGRRPFPGRAARRGPGEIALPARRLPAGDDQRWNPGRHHRALPGARGGAAHVGSHRACPGRRSPAPLRRPLHGVVDGRHRRGHGAAGHPVSRGGARRLTASHPRRACLLLPRHADRRQRRHRRRHVDAGRPRR